MMIAAMSSVFSANARSICVERAGLGFRRVALDLGRDGEAQAGIVDPRPRELGEVVGLARVGVRERQRVARAAVEGLAEVDHLLALLAGDPLRLVAPHLPVERGLDRVLDAERPALDEEGVAHVLGHREASERLDEARVLDRVEVGQRRLERRHPVQHLEELGVAQLGVVVADRIRREEHAEVEELAAAARVVEPRAVAALEVEHEVVAVREQVAREHGVNFQR